LRALILIAAASFATAITPHASAGWAEIERRLPPAGIEIPSEVKAGLQRRLSDFKQQADPLIGHELFADVEIFSKALRYALDLGEFYSEKDFAVAEKTIDQAFERLDQLKAGDSPWTVQRGLLVRGYRSSIDDSVQPYGLHIPEKLDLGQEVPLLIWLHGRGDKVTDMHFIQRCLSKNSALGGFFDAENVITVHPFGRQCVGWKHAGEIDVLEVLAEVKKHYKVDADRVVLAGFSMGGAGAWHIGAHYTDQFCAVHAGAGFAETARYNKLTPEQYPSEIEQTLWGLYDVPNYTRNLFNVPVIAYSGEEDRQKQAADVMAEAFAKEGRELPHLIGPGMGHKYHPEVAKEVQAFLMEAIHRGRDRQPAKVALQTQTLRYSKMNWLTVTGLEKHWQDSRVDAALIDEGLVNITSENVRSLRVDREMAAGSKVLIDGNEIVVPEAAAGEAVALTKSAEGWKADRADGPAAQKVPGLQGPIDDAFMSPFLVVLPSGKSAQPAVQRWVDFESQHFLDRWKALMRGDVRVKEDRDVTEDDIEQFNLVLWGDPGSNSIIARIISDLPVQWSAEKLQIGDQSFESSKAVPAMIYPSAHSPGKYVVLNSGLTFREDHDRTNSLQNPKLADWAVIGLEQAPDGAAPGKILATDFFDESWELR